MNILLLKVSLLTCLLFGSSFVDAMEPVTTGVAVGVAFVSSAFIAGFDLLKCTFYECCDAQWITPNITGTALLPIIAGYQLSPPENITFIFQLWLYILKAFCCVFVPFTLEIVLPYLLDC